jgi:hypothetical protein
LTEVLGLIRIDWQADVAQLVEQSIRNRQVIGSSPIVGSIDFNTLPTTDSSTAAQPILASNCFMAAVTSKRTVREIRR